MTGVLTAFDHILGRCAQRGDRELAEIIRVAASRDGENISFSKKTAPSEKLLLVLNEEKTDHGYAGIYPLE